MDCRHGMHGRQKRANSSVTERNDSSADSRKVGVLLEKQQARQLHSICVGGSLWAVRGVNTEALTMLRGPIRRRPYNRGEIVSKKRREMVVFNDFY
jgi:hypothetical protein